MPDESSASVNSKIGIDYQRKFTFYTVTLTFTILALAIQTANLGTYFYSDMCELACWVCLFVSGIVGLRKIEYTALFYFLSSYDSDVKGQDKKRFEDKKDAMQKSNMRKYKVQSSLFLIGLILLMVSRSYASIIKWFWVYEKVVYTD